ncbi:MULTISPECIES: sugar ABC transporter ATP-binding protein [unclassified Aeromicrobium]|uniref:sugar ABC transporter ATP-binding protein n=1 Tax=unclassified Aeromicrobium TaxID=2633570 RepID=UPI002889F661|nr:MULTISPECIES: sugar ABC transporter ATP-binding protein [unclassified Aeromicrobium]
MIDPAGGAQDVVLRTTGLSKTFAGTTVLKDARLEVRRGEIHALLGGNGSGKSTLIKVLAGVYSADAGGRIDVQDVSAPAEEWSPSLARSAGLHVVHQDPAVFGPLTVAENLAIGRGFARGKAGRIDWKATRRRAAQVLDRFSIDVSPTMLVADLRPADRTMLSIARALQDQEGAHDGVLVLDEPTASLPAEEVHRLLAALRVYAAAGQTILYVSHRLPEILELADRVTVLRDGAQVATRDVTGLDERTLVELIAGRDLERIFPDRPKSIAADTVLSVRGLVAGPLRGVDLDLNRGEVLGIAGLLGSGRTTLLRALFGDRAVDSGEITLSGRPFSPRSPSVAMRAGMALVPEDRGSEGLFGSLSVRENLSAAEVPRYWSGGRLQHRREREEATALVKGFDVRPASDCSVAGTLSGGNQQKVVMARWLRRDPVVLLLDEPTQGVDVRARSEIYEHVRRAIKQGTSVLLVTSDFEELAHLSDRVVVLREGRVAAEVTGVERDPQRLTELSYLSEEPT